MDSDNVEIHLGKDFETWWRSDENLWVHTRMTKLIAEKAWNYAFKRGLREGYDLGVEATIDRLKEMSDEYKPETTA